MMKNFEDLGVADRYHYFAKELSTAFDVSVGLFKIVIFRIKIEICIIFII